jgi:hypothetical protein
VGWGVNFVPELTLSLTAVTNELFAFSVPAKCFYSSVTNLTGDRCYDFKNIFAEKFGENIGVLFSNYC